MVRERILCVTIGCIALALFVAGVLYWIHLKKKGKSAGILTIWGCEIAVLLAIAYIAFTFPEFPREKWLRAWDNVKHNGYRVTVSDRVPKKKERRKIKKKKNFKTYLINGIYDDEMRVDLAPTENSPVK